MSIHSVSIFGLGLLGGSVAKAIKHFHPSIQVCAYNRSSHAIDKALNDGSIDTGFSTLDPTLYNSDLAIIATPFHTYDNLLSFLSKNTTHKQIITDIGSVQQYPLQRAQECLTNEQFQNFVSSHPIAGKEISGYEGSDAYLFDNKRIILTPGRKNNKQPIDLLKDFWISINGKPEELSAKTHDQIYAAISHLPQLLAFAAAKLKNLDKDTIIKHYPTSLRLANSNKELWLDIIKHNKPAIDQSIHNFLDAFDSIDEAKREQARIKASLYQQKHNDQYDALLPKIATALILSTNKEYLDYAGTGLKDFIAPLWQDGDIDTSTSKEEIYQALQPYLCSSA